MTNNNIRKFLRVGEYTDEWLTDGDLDFHVKHFPPGPEIGIYLFHNEDIYTNGYKIAADRLVSGLSKTDRSLMYPIMFLYRHYVELALKHALNLAYHVDLKSDSAPTTHNLKPLWDLLRIELDKYWPNEHHHHLERVGRYLTGLAKIAPTSMEFRYSYDKEGKVSVGNLSEINLEHLCNTVNQLSKFFEFCIRRLESNLAND